jgi:hypothetical protein
LRLRRIPNGDTSAIASGKTRSFQRRRSACETVTSWRSAASVPVDHEHAIATQTRTSTTRLRNMALPRVDELCTSRVELIRRRKLPTT